MGGRLVNKVLAAYGGDGPYVFVSYSHADKLVLRELGWLQDHGIDLWYDEGIHPSSRWTDYLAQQIKDSKLVLYFVTPNSAGSENCRNEIDYAIENHKHILVVHLEETELAEGQKLALNSFQAIMRPELVHKEYRAKLLLAITEALEMEFDAAQFRPGRAPLPKWVPAVAVVSVLAVLGISYTTVDILRQPPVVRAATDTLRSIISDFDNWADPPERTPLISTPSAVSNRRSRAIFCVISMAVRPQARKEVSSPRSFFNRSVTIFVSNSAPSRT